jgi:sec-independent protein translocase protein TatC
VGILATVRMGILSVGQLRAGRRYAWVICAIVAAALPGTDPVSMLLEMLPLLVLFEGSILLATLLDRRSARAAGRSAFAGDEHSELDDD